MSRSPWRIGDPTHRMPQLPTTPPEPEEDADTDGFDVCEPDEDLEGDENAEVAWEVDQ